MTDNRVWIEHDYFGGDREWKGGPPCWYCDLGRDEADCTCFEPTDEMAEHRIRIGAGHWKAS